jgi:YebC/PmpR family DNA-binding regulatory protein
MFARPTFDDRIQLGSLFMSGHSKWSTIKRKKGANDAKRGKLFTKLIKEITVSARDGGDEENNPRLRVAVQNAKGANMPQATIDRAIRRGTGEEPGAVYEVALYEGYGPAGVAVMVDTLSDNRNRTVAEVRHVFTKHGGNLAEKGAVAWMFTQKGHIEISSEKTTEEELMLAVLDAGAEDIQDYEGVFEVLCSIDAFEALKQSLESEGISFSQASLAWIPQNILEVAGENAEKIIRLLEDLEDFDDVQRVFSNFDIEEDEMQKLLS